MGAIQLREEWTRQPQYSAKIRGEYQKNLLGYFPNSGNDLPTYPLTFAGNAAYAATEFGRATKFDGNGDYTSAGDAFYSDEYSILVTVNADLLDANARTVIIKRNIGIGASTNEIWLYVTATEITFLAWNGAATLTLSSSGITPVAGKTYTIGIDIPPGTGTAYMYVNGVLVGSASKTFTIINSTSELQFGCMGSGASLRYWNGYIGQAAFWSKRLPNTQELTANPWAILEDEDLNIPFAASSNADLAGAAVVNPAASAAIYLSLPMVAAGIVVATSDGAMQLALPMSGNATGQASTAGGVSLSVPMAVSALIQALATAGITLSNPLGVIAAGVASSGGNMALHVSMSGAALIEALAAADLTVTGDGMSGSAIVQPSAAGNMSLGLPLATSSLVVSNTSGNITQIVPMVTSAASASLVTGGLDLAVTLNTAALIEALAVVSLTNDMNMGGAGAANAATMGNLTLRVNMSTAAIIQAMAAGGLAGNGQLVGTPGYRVTRAPRSWKVTRKPRSWRVSE